MSEIPRVPLDEEQKAAEEGRVTEKQREANEQMAKEVARKERAEKMRGKFKRRGGLGKRLREKEQAEAQEG
jgi:hypothetical protein